MKRTNPMTAPKTLLLAALLTGVSGVASAHGEKSSAARAEP
jgi:hypothetical protein